MPAARLLGEYRYRRIRPDAALYAVVGNPVAHSLSPAMHNAGFEHLGLNAAYVSLEARDADDFVHFARALKLQGASITAPFKVAMLERVDRYDALAAEVGAVNTLHAKGDRWLGSNTDVAGFVTPLKGRMALKGTRAAVLGAGGAARAVAVALKHEGATVRICARRTEKARQVASVVGVQPGPYPPPPGTWDVLVNATSAGSRDGRSESDGRGPARRRDRVRSRVLAVGNTARRTGPRRRVLDDRGHRDADRPGRASVRDVDGIRAAAGALPRRGRSGVRMEDGGSFVKQTTFEEFVDLARRGTFVPVVREIMADLLTPVSAFLKIAEHSDYAFLFESVEGGEQVARYSFLGKDPFLVLRARGGRTEMDRSGVTTATEEAFVPVLRRLMAEFQSPFVSGLPRFTGGAVGFIGYDAATDFEPVLKEAWNTAPWAASAGADEDDAGFMLFDTVLAFDHVKHRILIIANARVTADEDLGALYQFACAKIDFLERELERGLSHPEPRPGAEPAVRSNQTKEVFEAGVRTIQEHIAAGDIYQAVLSQRFEADVAADPFTVYRALRHVNPSPYMYFMRMGKLAIVGSSPEMLVRVEGRRVETHPIAGTRPRGASDDEDVRLAEELKRNEKERAEHVMLVDLGRNDLGRVCDFGTVRVPQYMAVERYSHVMHLVSTVDGRLAEEHDHFDALVACFPAGTVSGAPKIRAMQLLAGLEPTRRDLYAGAVGYIDFAGNLDFCIAIRTITIRDGRARVQAGAGIVADSNAAAEYEETRDKARALLQALAMAEAGL